MYSFEKIYTFVTYVRVLRTGCPFDVLCFYACVCVVDYIYALLFVYVVVHYHLYVCACICMCARSTCASARERGEELKSFCSRNKSIVN